MSGIVIMPFRVMSYSKAESERSGFMGTGSSSLDERHVVRNVRGEVEAGGKAGLQAGGDVAVQAARITAGEDIGISAEDGRISLLKVKDAFYERHVESNTGYFSWSSSDKGKQDETVLHTEIHPGTSLQIVTADGLVVEYRDTGNVREDIIQLAQSPGLPWMGELLQRDDVDWQKVQEVHDAWKEEQSGVGGPGVMLVSLAVAVMSYSKVESESPPSWARVRRAAMGIRLSGADTTVSGANIECKTVAMDVGGDLLVKSEQDKRAMVDFAQDAHHLLFGKILPFLSVPSWLRGKPVSSFDWPDKYRASHPDSGNNFGVCRQERRR